MAIRRVSMIGIARWAERRRYVEAFTKSIAQQGISYSTLTDIGMGFTTHLPGGRADASHWSTDCAACSPTPPRPTQRRHSYRRGHRSNTDPPRRTAAKRSPRPAQHRAHGSDHRSIGPPAQLRRRPTRNGAPRHCSHCTAACPTIRTTFGTSPRPVRRSSTRRRMARTALRRRHPKRHRIGDPARSWLCHRATRCIAPHRLTPGEPVMTSNRTVRRRHRVLPTDHERAPSPEHRRKDSSAMKINVFLTRRPDLTSAEFNA